MLGLWKKVACCLSKRARLKVGLEALFQVVGRSRAIAFSFGERIWSAYTKEFNDYLLVSMGFHWYVFERFLPFKNVFEVRFKIFVLKMFCDFKKKWKILIRTFVVLKLPTALKMSF
jgi:hypothetical protein